MAMEKSSAHCVLAWQRQRQICLRQQDQWQASAAGPDVSRQHVSCRDHQARFDRGYFGNVHNQPPSSQPCATRRSLQIQVCRCCSQATEMRLTLLLLRYLINVAGATYSARLKFEIVRFSPCAASYCHPQVPFALWIYPAQCC